MLKWKAGNYFHFYDLQKLHKIANIANFVHYEFSEKNTKSFCGPGSFYLKSRPAQKETGWIRKIPDLGWKWTVYTC